MSSYIMRQFGCKGTQKIPHVQGKSKKALLGALFYIELLNR